MRGEKDARRVLSILQKIGDRVHAWDTETVDIEVKEQSPVGAGKILCFSGYCGPDVDFGNGPRLFIDNYGERTGLVDLFKGYFEDKSYLKCWFNYGFDRHIFYNHGIDVKGFGGDVMHMARLEDPTRGLKGYSLSALTEYYRKEIEGVKRLAMDRLQGKQKEYARLFIKDNIKMSMTNLFSRRRILQNGMPGATLYMPSLVEIHTSEELLPLWVHYSTRDAESTYYLREVMVRELQKYRVTFEDMSSLFDLYIKYWLPFGECLTDLERVGIRVNRELLAEAERKATADAQSLENKFISWVHNIQPNARGFNPSSTQQLQQLLFAPFSRQRVDKRKGEGGGFTPENMDMQEDEDVPSGEGEESEYMQRMNMRAEENERTKIVKKKRNIDEVSDFPLVREFKVENTTVGRD